MPKRLKKQDMINLNKEIAYKGAIGKKREKYIRDLIKKKNITIKNIEKSQSETIEKNNETITCHKGCYYCCNVYSHASIQECEAIVHYLYQNENVMKTFLKNYQTWRKKLHQNGDIFVECAELWYEKSGKAVDSPEDEAFKDAAARYRKQKLTCPFLSGCACSIYEVRPYLCAGTVATSPPEWCQVSNIKQPKMYRTQTPAMFDKSFYYNEIDAGYIFTFFPIAVYEILETGYKAIEKFTGLDGLEEAAMESPTVKKIVRQYMQKTEKV